MLAIEPAAHRLALKPQINGDAIVSIGPTRRRVPSHPATAAIFAAAGIS
jgi:hypothetical protein